MPLVRRMDTYILSRISFVKSLVSMQFTCLFFMFAFINPNEDVANWVSNMLNSYFINVHHVATVAVGSLSSDPFAIPPPSASCYELIP